MWEHLLGGKYIECIKIVIYLIFHKCSVYFSSGFSGKFHVKCCIPNKYKLYILLKEYLSRKINPFVYQLSPRVTLNFGRKLCFSHAFMVNGESKNSKHS